MNAHFVKALHDLGLPYTPHTQTAADMHEQINKIQTIERKSELPEIKSKRLLFVYNDVCIADAYIANDAQTMPKTLVARVFYCSGKRLAEVAFQKKQGEPPILQKLLSASDSAKRLSEYTKHKPKTKQETCSVVEFASTSMSASFKDDFAATNNCTEKDSESDTNKKKKEEEEEEDKEKLQLFIQEDERGTNVYEMHAYADALLYVLQQGVDYKTLYAKSECRSSEHARSVRNFATEFAFCICTYLKHLRVHKVSHKKLHTSDFLLLYALAECADVHFMSYVLLANEHVIRQIADNNAQTAVRRGAELVHFFVSSAVIQWRKSCSCDYMSVCDKNDNKFVYECGVLHTNHKSLITV